MDVILLLLIIFSIVARRNAVYHPNMLFKKSITLKNKLLRRILVPKRSKLYKNEAEESRNKMVITPFILGFIATAYCAFVIVKEDFYAQSINQIGYNLTTDASLNMIIFFISMALLSAAILLINTIKCYKRETTVEKIRFVLRILFAVIFTVGFIATMVVVITMYNV